MNNSDFTATRRKINGRSVVLTQKVFYICKNTFGLLNQETMKKACPVFVVLGRLRKKIHLEHFKFYIK